MQEAAWLMLSALAAIAAVAVLAAAVARAASILAGGQATTPRETVGFSHRTLKP